MARLETQYDRDTLVTLRRNCQCGYGMDGKLELLKELMKESDSIEKLADQAASQAAGLSCLNGELYLEFDFFPCPMLADVDKLATDTWCQCTTGYSKVLFEKAFGCDIDVVLLKSIKMGDDICLMKIIPLSLIKWHNI